MSAFLEAREGRRAETRTSPEALEFIGSGAGWRVVSPASGDRGGMVAHRGVLHPAEYVNPARLVPAVERHLGFTLADLRTVYRQGRKSASHRELRARVDSRLLEVANAGGNLELLARVTGIDRKTIGKALTRARVARGDRRPHPNSARVAYLKQRLAVRDDGARCRYCGQRHKLRDLTIDHVVPLSRGGTNALPNLVLACGPCNHAKADQLWEETA